jgi:predicted RNase H-like nuclease (RuvC/YqgF family)
VSDSLIVEILLGLLTVAVTVAAFLSAKRANEEQSKSERIAVDAAAYQRAKEIYEGALDALHTEVNGLRTEVSRLRNSNNRLQDEVATLHQEIALLRGRA